MTPLDQLSTAALTRTVLRITLIIIALAIGLYVVYLLRRPISWIFIAGFIAVAVTAPVNWLDRRLPRSLAIALVYLLVMAFPFVMTGLVIPPVLAEGAELVDNLPAYASDLQRFVQGNETLRRLDSDFQLAAQLQQRAEQLPGQIDEAAGALGGFGLGVVNSIFALLTILILSVFMVSSGPRWARAALALQPAERRERLERVGHEMSATVGNYVAGAFVQAVVAGVTAFAVLSLLGVPFALPLAVVVALFDLIPLVGATIAAVLVGIVTLFDSFPTTTIVWAIYAVIYQQVENTLIQPQIQKRAVAVNPFVVLVAVLFGSTLFGIIGALVAIPVAASFQILIREWWAWRELQRREAAAAGAVSSTHVGALGPGAATAAGKPPPPVQQRRHPHP